MNADLPRIRDRDWLITTNEIDADAVTVSTAVRDRDGAVIAALSIVSSVVRLGPLRPHGMLTPLIEAAGELGGCSGDALSRRLLPLRERAGVRGR